MIRIGIAEDDQAYIDQIQEYLNRYMREYGETFSVSVFRNGMQLAFDYQPVYDILLLDVEMPVLDGISAARRIRKLDGEVIILFITNMAQYAIDGYAVRARSYILKPINYYGFSLELQEAIESLKRRQVNALLLPTDDGLTKVPIGRVIYVESQKHDLLLHTSGETIRIRAKMKEMEEKLQDYYFCRSSVSYLINLAHVNGISGDSVLVGGKTLPISRQRRKEFIAALTAYIGGSTHV